jgi:ribosomal protein S18 acetylase RimI-like enzyme
MNAIRIRRATVLDLEGVYTLFDLADRLHRQAHPEIFREAADPQEIKAYLRSELRNSETAIFAAEEQGRLVGVVLAKLQQTSDNPLLVRRRYVSVENLVVAEECRQRGVGQALMEQVHRWAKAQDIHAVYLTVWEFNQSAQALYRKLGYEMLHHRMRKELP